jgi:hypothetical protein
MYAREMSRQKQEFMIGCGVLNKMTSLGMPVSGSGALLKNCPKQPAMILI